MLDEMAVDKDEEAETEKNYQCQHRNTLWLEHL